MMTKHRRVYRKLLKEDDDRILELLERLLPVSVIAQRLGCDRRTLAARIKHDEVLRLAHRDAVDSLGDLAESRLFEKINGGELGAICWYLEHRCPDRYGKWGGLASVDGERRVVIIGAVPENIEKEVQK